jgi:type IV pilus assembly protein PilY1
MLAPALIWIGTVQADSDSVKLDGDHKVQSGSITSLYSGFFGSTLNIDDLKSDPLFASSHIVDRPSAGYDLQFSDETYANFRRKYYHRRHVVYVGSSDGVLHAFNGGFLHNQGSVAEFRQELRHTGTEMVGHSLGSELWAYVPKSALTYVNNKTSVDDPNTYFVDGFIRHYDVNIFVPDVDHPNGWGTILVVGTGVDGAVGLLNDPNVDIGSQGKRVASRSSYLIFDVTNPEVEPKVLAEIASSDLGYAIREPALIKMRESASDGSAAFSKVAKNEWLLVFPSDLSKLPTLNSSENHQTSSLFAYDLKSKQIQQWPLAESDRLIGAIQSIDWNRDYKDDAVYYSAVSDFNSKHIDNLKMVRLQYKPHRVTGRAAEVVDSHLRDTVTPMSKGVDENVKKSSRQSWIELTF